jgi:hypothetical protein
MASVPHCSDRPRSLYLNCNVNWEGVVGFAESVNVSQKGVAGRRVFRRDSAFELAIPR